VPGATVTLYADSTAIGSAVASDTSTTITTNGSVTLNNSVHSFTARQLEPGKAQSTDSPAQAVTNDTAAPAVPAAPNLQAGSDSGSSNSDDLTNLKTLTFDLTASPYFRFIRNGVQISGDYQAGGTYTAAGQPSGTSAYAVMAVDAAGNVST